MDASWSARPSRRRAHVCRICDLEFTCRAELLEHEQDAHSARSASNSSSLSSKRRLIPDHPGGSSAGTSPVRLQSVGKKVNDSQLPFAALSLPENLLIDHEEVLKSLGKTKAHDVTVQRTTPVSAMSAPPMVVGSGGTGAVQRTDGGSVSTASHQAGTVRSAARPREQEPLQHAGERSGLISAAITVSQITASPSVQMSHASYTGVQNRGPVTVVPSTSADRDISVSTARASDVIAAVGLARKGHLSNVTTASSGNSGNPNTGEDDTKPPDSDRSIDICRTALDGRQVTGYKILGSINQEPAALGASDSDMSSRNSRDIGVQVFPSDLTKEEANDCLVDLHHGGSFASPVNNDELQLLAAVSSTRSRDIVEPKPEMISPVGSTPDPVATTQDTVPVPTTPVPGSPEQKQEEMTDIVLTDPMDTVEQEVVLETMEYETEPRRGWQTKKQKSPVCIVNLQMTPHQFTATDGAKKRMVAFTVTQPQRMVSVLLRNQQKDDSGEQEERPMTTAEAEAESVDREADDETKPVGTVAANAVAELVSDTSIIADIAAIAAAKAAEEGTDVLTGLFKENDKEKYGICMYCEQAFLRDEIEEHIRMDHICNQCGRKFRQPTNLRKVYLKMHI